MERLWCAAKRCPFQNDCQGYINRNEGNETVLPLTACCKALCGASASEVGILALQCGGTSSVTAYMIVLYIVILFSAGAYMVLGGWILSLKRFTFWITVSGTAIFMTGTGVFVTYLTSPFRILETVPAVGGMNIAILSYFFSGFQYSIGVAYEGGPLIALAATAYPIWRAILKAPGDGFLRDGNRIALVMLVMAFIWVLHSVSYRILGYRVEWMLTDAPRKRGNTENVNMCYLLGAAQGHPTWRTPVGQSTSFVLTVLAWVVLAAVLTELENQQCRPDWVFILMLWVPPPLISGAVCYNLLSALRSRRILGIADVQHRNPLHYLRNFFHMVFRRDNNPDDGARRGEYPGKNLYHDFFGTMRNRRMAYVQAVALHRRGRNTYFIENVTNDRLEWQDRLIGCSAWLLATLGVVMSAPVVLLMYVLATHILGRVLEKLPCAKVFVTTTVTRDVHKTGADRVLEESYVGWNLGSTSQPSSAEERRQRYINLPYLLDNIGPEELHVLLNE